METLTSYYDRIDRQDKLYHQADELTDQDVIDILTEMEYINPILFGDNYYHMEPDGSEWLLIGDNWQTRLLILDYIYHDYK